MLTFNEIEGATGFRVEWTSALDEPWNTFSNVAVLSDYIPTLGGGVMTAQVPMVYRVFAETNWPEPTEKCAYYTDDLDFPQTQSANNLAKFMASEHFKYDLDG